MAIQKERVNAIRHLQSTAGISPSVRVPVNVSGLSVADILAFQPFMQLARVKSIEQRDDLPKMDAPVATWGSAKFMLNVEVDITPDRPRFQQETAPLEATIPNAT